MFCKIILESTHWIGLKTMFKIFTVIISITPLFNLNAQEISYSSKNLRFKSKGITLSGTVYDVKSPKAGILLVHGSGQELRMKEFATTLAKSGYTVLTYDKRGVGESEGVYAGPEVGTNNIDSTNLDLLAEDVHTAVNVLSQKIKNKKTKIGLMGFSQAGWIIPIAANKNKKVDFMVIFSGALISTKEQLRFQFYTNGDTDFWKKHTEKDAREHIKNDTDRYEFINTDPVYTLNKLSIPGLWIFGGKDIQVPVNLSIEILEELNKNGKQFQHKLYPDLGHNTAASENQETIKEALNWINNL